MAVISVICPAYNSEKYLAQCVGSMLGQTYADWELVLVDDGSTDSTPAMCDEYAAADSRIKVYHFSNGGLSVARNRGLAKATGRYVYFLDSDDTLHPRTLEAMASAADANPDCAFQSRFAFSPEGMPSSDCGMHFPVVRFGLEEALELMLYQRRLLHAAGGHMYPRHLIPADVFRPDIMYEDLDAMFRLHENCKGVVLVDAPLYYYRTNPSSLINTFSPRRLDVLNVTQRLEKYVADKFPALQAAAADRRLSANFNIYCLLGLHNLGNSPEARDCWNLIRRYRCRSLLNPKVRMKNRLGIICSYLGGRTLVGLLARHQYN